MAGQRLTLSDDAARTQAVAVHGRSFLVEAGAGSGKTAVMAGRIAMLLAGGTEPASIAAVTFTEFAASELLIRVRAFVSALAAGNIPVELRAAFPDGLSDEQRGNLAEADAALDEMTCSTIHGFCQRLIAPYPVEADIDPGASVMDRDQAEVAFAEIVDAWLREELAGKTGGLLAELVLHDPDAAVALVRTVLDHLRRHREFAPYELQDLALLATALREAADGFAAFLDEAEAEEPETAIIAGHFETLAENIEAALPADTPARLVALLLMTPHDDLLSSSGGFYAYRKKGKWQAALRKAGLAQADADRLNDGAGAHYALCRAAWTGFHQAVATHVLAGLVPFTEPVLDRFRQHKRAAALLDFDDLIFSARDLLRDHDDVRRALAVRYRHVLVDEFQDTDPLQTEIFWRLCGEPPEYGDAGDWTAFALRPGALFLVGDPKQAIYRFRGADIAAYVRAREAFRARDGDAVLSIATNFRSCAPIMDYVNRRFETALSEENGQPGFQALDPFQPARDEGPSVAALDIEVADEDGRASAARQRDGEAEAVAELCARLIGSEPVRDPANGEPRPCRAGDIALLAPTGSELWRYEEALEARGIPVATQAGKGLYRRQEIQDLISVTRVLADRRDTLALGALLRGPLVGLTEEELLDIVWALPRADDAPDDLPRLDLGVAPEAIKNPLARDIMEKLQALQRRVNATTPHALLSQAVDVLRVRPILLRRHRGQAERALANVDLYLSYSRAYAVRGLRAFAEAMTAAWSDETRAVEGRPDAQEDAVALYTMHAAKGLEWPIVVPINTMTRVMAPESAVTDRASGRFYCRVFGVGPTGYDTARDDEKAELDRERVRLWYVAATRARELLVLPRLDVDGAASAWLSVVDLALPELPALDMEHLSPEFGAKESETENVQTREVFAAEAAAIAERTRAIFWRAPSRDEGIAPPEPRDKAPTILATDGDGAPADGPAVASVQGGRERGLILHKLIEEVLTGETAENLPDLRARSEVLIRVLGRSVMEDPAEGLAPAELAGSVVRALSLPEVGALRPRLLPEFTVHAATDTDTHEEVAAGIVDAIAFGADGAPEVVVDWKSDIDAAPETIEHYRAQVRAYLEMTGAELGLIVAVTTGTVVRVVRTAENHRGLPTVHCPV
ncbi:MAG: UvrD-helicase domain-containing protein [Rhodospirillales bacterium]|nr:UvrD-helicase domain-containing protein [Rhodospirillales bacterium]